jgi:hypothetical protein
MMGGGAFTPLKVGRAGPKSAKQVEIGLAILLKILCFARRRQAKICSRERERRATVAMCGSFAHDMANGPGMARFVIQNTVFALQLTWYPAGNCE